MSSSIVLRHAGQQPSSVRWGAPDEDPAASSVGVASAEDPRLFGQKEIAVVCLHAAPSDSVVVHLVCRRHIDLARTCSALCRP